MSTCRRPAAWEQYLEPWAFSGEAATWVRPAESCGVESLIGLVMIQGHSWHVLGWPNNPLPLTQGWPLWVEGIYPDLDNCITTSTSKRWRWNSSPRISHGARAQAENWEVRWSRMTNSQWINTFTIKSLSLGDYKLAGCPLGQSFIGLIPRWGTKSHHIFGHWTSPLCGGGLGTVLCENCENNTVTLEAAFSPTVGIHTCICFRCSLFLTLWRWNIGLCVLKMPRVGQSS